ncbi:MAG TPA: ABC transporter substrate-binding protein [Bauldia sp.]|nr:ABC transporter substrate-binding protein [Bauldia sp.]
MTRKLTRRTVLKGAAASAAAVGASSIFAPAVHAASPVKIGYVTPQSGPLAPFAEADKYVIDTMTKLIGGGVKGAGGDLPIQIVTKDSQSDPNRAAEAAKSLIVDDKVDIIVVSSTPETTNPVSTVAEQEEVPCISTVAPWQPWFIGRQANPGDPGSWKPFNSTFHYFWGLEDIIAVFSAMWDQIETNKQVGGLFPNDGDGNAWGDPNVGIAPGLKAAGGYIVNDPGRYQDLNDDFTAQITAFKNAKTDIVTGVVIPPDFTTFWTQANQQGLKPKAVTVAKALLFPSSVEALGALGNNLSSEVWWSPTHPFKSSLTGASTADVAKQFSDFSGRPWTQPIGYVYSLFEVAIDVLKRASDASDSASVIEAIKATNLDTIVGKINWGKDKDLGPIAANVCKTPLVGGQWRTKDNKSFELVIVDNSHASDIPAGGKMEPLG